MSEEKKRYSEEFYTYLEPIANGVKVLTEYFGDDSWKGRINPDTLVMSSRCNCILGQLFGEYEDGLDQLNVKGFDGVPWGFDVSYGDYEIEKAYRDLTKAWREYLMKNKAKEE